MARTIVAATTAVLGALLAACGDGERARGPAVDAPAKTQDVGASTDAALDAGRSREPSAETPVPARDEAPAAPEPSLAAMEAEIERLERECVPAKGVSRKEVEARFGAGEPAVVSKVHVEAPADSPYREYRFCEDGVLGVRFDEEWRVSSANFHDPYSLKGRPVGKATSAELREGELRPRLAQMKRIREEYRRRFGE